MEATATTQKTRAELRAELKSGLPQFYGTENYYGHWLGLVYTDGVQYLAETAGAYWLIDAIASWQRELLCGKLAPEIKDGLKNYQFWTLKVNEATQSAELTCEYDTGVEVCKQKIPFTDFPLPEIKIWVEGGVILLPSEH